MKKLLVVQRVLTPYRLKLLELLASHYEVTVITSKGEQSGALKLAKGFEDSPVNVKVVKSIKVGYSGESRSTKLFLYPLIVFRLFKFDLLLLEGTTNLFNNMFIVPMAKLLGKPMIWWDAGYSPNHRTKKRAFIDKVVGRFVGLTDAQVAYSTKARDYMSQYMNAKNCHVLLNTINTEYYEKNRDEILANLEQYSPKENELSLLYTGAIEERKNIKELINIVQRLNKKSSGRTYLLKVIGGGQQLEELRAYVSREEIQEVELLGPIYNPDDLRNHYLKSDLFVLPGDGGLAIVQSILFGLPVICCAADGTELDYLEQQYILDSPQQLEGAIEKYQPSKANIESRWDRLYSSKWVGDFNKIVTKL